MAKSPALKLKPYNKDGSAGVTAGSADRTSVLRSPASQHGRGVQAASWRAISWPVDLPLYPGVSAAWKRRKRRAPSARAASTLNRYSAGRLTERPDPIPKRDASLFQLHQFR